MADPQLSTLLATPTDTGNAGIIQYSGLLATFGSTGKSGAAQGFYLDADYSVAQPCGVPVPNFPFLNQGDTSTVIFRQPFEQAVVSYAPLDLTTQMPGVTNAYPLGDTNFRDGKAGVWEFERTYGNIPKSRVRRGQSHVYAFQYLLSSGMKLTTDPDAGTFSYEGPTYTLQTLPFKVDSQLTYDYFLAGNESQFPLLEAPMAIQIGQNIDCRGNDINGGPFPLSLVNSRMVGLTNGIVILAEDDAYDDFLGAIRCRVRRTIVAPDLAFWLNNSTT